MFLDITKSIGIEIVREAVVEIERGKESTEKGVKTGKCILLICDSKQSRLIFM